jgi:hypothetical protein
MPGAVRWWEWATVAVLWLLAVIVVNPIADIPLNDDWVYATSVHRLLDESDFRPIAWVQALHVSHAIWGAAFAWFGGLDYTVLRMSTLALWLAGLLACFGLLRWLGAGIAVAAMVTLVAMANPLLTPLAFTFMTDVPFAMCLFLGAAAFSVHLRTGSKWMWALGIALAAAATLNRQVGLVLPAAFFAVALVSSDMSRGALLRASMPLLLCCALLAVVEIWMRVTDRVPQYYGLHVRRLLSMLMAPAAWRSAARHAFEATLYLGFFLLPVLAWIMARIWHGLRPAQWSRVGLVVAIVAATVTFWAVLESRFDGLMPLGGNIIVGSGIGPLTLRDTYILGHQAVVPFPLAFWLGVTMLSVLGAALLVVVCAFAAVGHVRSFRGARLAPGRMVSAILLLSAAMYLAPAVAAGFFDRYLIPGLALLAAGLAAWTLHDDREPYRPSATLAMGVSYALVVSLAAILGAHDYLAWNKARWALLERHEAAAPAAAQTTDGGYEYNGLRNYRADYRVSPLRSWWWVVDDRYVVAFGPIDGYRERDKESYSRLLPPGQGSILLLERASPGPGD